MRTGSTRAIAIAAVSAMAVTGAGTGLASAKMIKLPTLQKQAQLQQQAASKRAIYPSAPPCPENGILSGSPLGSTGLIGNCGISEAPGTGVPFMGPMAYWGGKVQTQPHEYIVFWGWGQPGAFTNSSLYSKVQCSDESFSEGAISATLGCDPEGAGRYMADFVNQMGGTQWANLQDQYFQTDASGRQTYINEKGNVLAGIWVDDSNGADLSKTTASATAGSPDPNPSANAAQPSANTYTDLAAEASRAAAHFGLTKDQLINSNIIIAQAPAFSDPNALSQGYCAFHDYTLGNVQGSEYYKDPAVTQGVVYTNIPYVNAIQTGGSNDCGQYSVNGDPKGVNDDFSIALGHEIQEAATDPGAEDIIGNATTSSETYYGGWYDPFDANENGDKCAYVGTPLVGGLPGEPAVLPVPGAIGDIKGSDGGTFAVQSLWSNASAGGAGYCAGIASTDLPGPLAGEGPYGSETLLGLSKKALALGAKAKAGRHGKRHAKSHKHHSGKGHSAKAPAKRA